MNSRRWRGGVIGCGFFAVNQMHAWRALPNVEIVALCDLDVNKASEMAAQFGVPSVYSDVHELLERERLDFIDIVTTVTSHRALVELAARHCRLIICQKPFSETLTDADRMLDVCAQAGVSLLVHENFRWQQPFQVIASRLQVGAIGALHSCRLKFRHAYDIYAGQPYLACVDRLALFDVGTHLFDVARVLAGDVRSIWCRTERLNPAVRGEDTFIAKLQHVNGASTVVDCCFFDNSATHLFPQTLALLEGSEGSLELRAEYRLRETHGSSVQEHLVEPEVPSWGAKPWHCIQDSVMRLQCHAIDVLEGRAEPHPSGAHNRDTLALVLAAYESASRDRVVQL